MINSLRARSLVGGGVAIAMFFSAAYYGRTILQHSNVLNTEISTVHNDLRHAINALKSPLLDAESNLYLHALVLTEQQRNKTLRQIAEFNAHLDVLEAGPLLDGITPDLKTDAQQLQALAAQITFEVNKLMGFGPIQRYPSITLLNEKMRPATEKFNGSLAVAIAVNNDLLVEEKQREIKQILMDLRYNWAQMISTTHAFIGARSGIYGSPVPRMDAMKKNMDIYASAVDKWLAQLLVYKKRQLLGIQKSAALSAMRAAKTDRDEHVRELVRALYADDWRKDVSYVLTVIKPLFNQAHSLIALMERRVETMTAFNLQKTADATAMLAGFLWGVGLLVLLLFAVLYFEFEFWIRRPVVQVAEAMHAVGRTGEDKPLALIGLEEIDSLIKAFHLMQGQVRQRQLRIASILDNAGEGVITLDDSGLIQSFNIAATTIFNYGEKEILGRTIDTLMPKIYQRGPPVTENKFKVWCATKAMGLVMELQGERYDGSAFPLDLTVSVMNSGDARAFICVIREITARKKAELNLHLAKEQAEIANELTVKRNHELQMSMQQLTEAQQQLVEAEKMASLGGLVAGVAHEINTPLGIGVTAVSHLEQELKIVVKAMEEGTLTKASFNDYATEVAEATHIVHANLDRAADLVKSFKQVAVDQTSEELREFDLGEYIREVLLSLRPKLKATQHAIEVECPEALIIHSAPGAISQILTNLMMNSLIHAYDEDIVGTLRIVVEHKLDADSKGDVVISYSDDGKGMDETTRENVFEPFYTTRRGQGGSGLGMHIVYNMAIQSLNGSIICKSELGEGVTFVIRFPVERGE